MKNCIYILALFLCAIGCEPDPINNPNPTPPGLTDLSFDKIKNYAPLNLLTQGAHLIYVNSQGKEKVLTLHVEHEMRKQLLDGIFYQAEFQTIEYVDSLSSAIYSPYISMQMEYLAQGKTIKETLVAGIFTADESYNPSISYYATGKLVSGDLLPQIEINGHSYQTVATNWFQPQGPASFSRMYYTTDQGIVGFEGEVGEMWALDRIEH